MSLNYRTVAAVALLSAVPLPSLNMFLSSLDILACDFKVPLDAMAWAISGIGCSVSEVNLMLLTETCQPGGFGLDVL